MLKNIKAESCLCSQSPWSLQELIQKINDNFFIDMEIKDLSTASKGNLHITAFWRSGEETFVHLYKVTWNQQARRNIRSGSKLGKWGKEYAKGQTKCFYNIQSSKVMIWLCFGCVRLFVLMNIIKIRDCCSWNLNPDTFTFTRHETRCRYWHSNHSGPELKIWFTLPENWRLEENSNPGM